MKQFCRFWIWSETECKTPADYGLQYNSTPPHEWMYLQSINLLNRMPQSLLTGQLKEKPTYRVLCDLLWLSPFKNVDNSSLSDYVTFRFVVLTFFHSPITCLILVQCKATNNEQLHWMTVYLTLTHYSMFAPPPLPLPTEPPPHNAPDFLACILHKRIIYSWE